MARGAVVLRRAGAGLAELVAHEAVVPAVVDVRRVRADLGALSSADVREAGSAGETAVDQRRVAGDAGFVAPDALCRS